MTRKISCTATTHTWLCDNDPSDIPPEQECQCKKFRWDERFIAGGVAVIRRFHKGLWDDEE